MMGRLILYESDECQLLDYTFGEDLEPFGYCISINTDLSKDFVSLISNTGDLDESFEYFGIIGYEQKSSDFFKQCREKQLELLQNAEYITFDFSVERIAEYIKRNPILKTKKIVFNEFLNLEIVREIEKYFGNETANIYFNVQNDLSLVSFKDFADMVKVIYDMAQEIEKYDLSSLEKIMYAYDLVRNKVYKKAEEYESRSVSRDLVSSLLGDKIVCLGYSRIFQTLLEILGIDSNIVNLFNSDRTSGHARNEIYIKDEKYGVDGVYYFDPTWDSKKIEDDNSYLLSYKFFAMTKDTMDLLDKGKLIDDAFPYFSPDMMWELEEIVELRGFENLSQQMINSVNHMSILINGKPLIKMSGLLPSAPASFRPNKDEVVDSLFDLVEYFSKPLSADILLKVLYNVRKFQYNHNPQKYQFSLEDFYKIFIKSGWEFEATSEERLELLFVRSEQRQKNNARRFARYIQEINLQEDIERVKVKKY